MFEQPRPSLNIRAVIRDMIDEEHELLTALGQDFLTTRVDEVETKLNRWQRYLKNHYSDGNLLPRGDAGKLHIYQIEWALTKRLATESQTEPFPTVHQRALKQARHRARLLMNKRDLTNASIRAARFEARLEQELLVELWTEWHTWLKPWDWQNATT